MSVKYFWHERRVAKQRKNYKIGYYDGHGGEVSVSSDPNYKKGYASGLVVAITAEEFREKQTWEIRNLESKLQASHDHMERVSRAVAVP